MENAADYYNIEHEFTMNNSKIDFILSLLKDFHSKQLVSGLIYLCVISICLFGIIRKSNEIANCVLLCDQIKPDFCCSR